MECNDENLIKMRDGFRETADIIDELIALSDRESKGEDVTRELESVVGRFMIKLMQLNELDNK